jgi:hypothetical protein
VVTSRWRIWTAAGLIAVGLVISARLIPPYLDNLEFQRYLEQLVAQPEARARHPEILRTEIMNHASQLGIPLTADHVDIRRSAERLRVETRYIVRVDLALYTVDLHFRPAAGS